MVRNKTGPRFSTYTVVRDDTLLWPKGEVFYKIDDEFDDELDKKVILDGIELIQASTCIQFIERTDQANYISIVPRQGRCASYVGMQGEEQSIALDLYQCPNKGQVAHELMHAIGFFHEHSRPDREDYVDVKWDNIQTGARESFELKPDTVADTLGQKYDYESVMHYPEDSFSINPQKPTLVPKKNDVDPATLGKGYLEDFLTPTDITKIKLLYKCAA